MFCPKCGTAEQLENTYCRQCGNFLPDFDKLKKRESSAEDHLKANSFLSLLTAVVSLSLSVTLYVMFFNRNDTPFVIYLVAGFLTAICAWQVQTFWRTLLLKKHFRKQKYEADHRAEPIHHVPVIEGKTTRELLNEADHSQTVPASVTDETTRRLRQKVGRRSS